MNALKSLLVGIVAALLLASCGGSAPPVANLTLSGTAARGLALPAASVSVKCSTGTSSGTTDANGQFQISVSAGVLPCVLQVTDASGTTRLHSIAAGSGNAVTANVTPLTEMVTARAAGSTPAAFFSGLNTATLAQTITAASVAAAHADVVQALTGTVNAQAVGNFITTALIAATSSNPGGGDVQDKLIDALNTALNPTQITEVISALASGLPTAEVKQAVGDRANANQSRLTSTFDLSNNMVTLKWLDSFADGTKYRIESRGSDGSFTLVETIPGIGGASAAMQWQRAASTDTVYRVVAVLPTSSVAIATPQGQSIVSAPVQSVAPTIVAGMDEPLSGSVQLSVSGPDTYTKVYWYVDLRSIGTGAGEGNAISWNTAAETNGAHLVLAKVEVATDSFIEIRRSVQVANSNLALNASVSGTTGTINIDASASSQYGISRVSATFDGNTLGTLSQPNACSSRLGQVQFGCGSSNNVFRFTVDAATAGSGSHTVVVTASDAAGASKSVTVAVPISNLPVLTVSNPQDGAFVYGTLNLDGTVASDKAGAVTVVASLGDYQFMSSSSATFTGSMSLAGLNPGAYTLTVRATDSSKAVTVIQRTIIVASSAALAYTPNFSMGTNGQLVAIDDSNANALLYSTSAAGLRMRNVSTGSEVTLQGTGDIPHLYNWVMDSGKAFVEGMGFSDCTGSCLYQWSEHGVRSNLSTNNPNKKTYEQHPAAHKGYVIWANTSGANPGSYTLYDTSSGTYTKVAQPSGANYIGNWQFDFVVQNGVIKLAYWAQTGGSGTSSNFDVFLWSSTTNTSTRLSSGSGRNIYPQIDGQSIAWLQSAVGSTSSSTIVSMPMAGGSVSTISSTANENFKLKDGVLAWIESSSTSRALKTLSNGTTSIVSSLTSSIFYGTSGGYVIYGEAGKVYAWNAATRSSTLLIDAAPSQIKLSGSTLYFVMGSGKVVYKLVLS